MDNLDKYTFSYPVDGQLLSTEPFTNGNMLYATAQFLYVQYGLSTDQFLRYNTGIRFCRAPNGAYARTPQLAENTSVDDYLAITCFGGPAVLVLSAARKRFGFLDINPSGFRFSQFLFRFQGLWQHMRISAREKIGLFGQLMWAISIFLAARQPVENQDSWIQSHLMILVATRSSLLSESWICQKACKYWWSKKTAPTSEIMAKYIGDPSHPLVTAWQGHY